MILNLKKRVDILTNENTQLRNLLKTNDNNQTTTSGTTSIVQAQQPIAPIRNGSRKISAKSISDYDIQDDLGDTQSIRLVILLSHQTNKQKLNFFNPLGLKIGVQNSRVEISCNLL